MQFTDREKALLKEYLQSFAVERELFLVLHQRVCAEHPEWVTNGDARSNILAKPVNLILTALANFHLLEHVANDITFWQQTVGIQKVVSNQDLAAETELGIFYRVATLTFLFSALEHGCRSILRSLDPSARSEGPFKRVYDHLFTAVATVANATDHIKLLDLLRTVRNTIHNNGVYLPASGEDAEFVLVNRTFTFMAGKRAEYFGWDTVLLVLPPIRQLLTDLLDAPEIRAKLLIEDVACHL